MMYEKIVNKAWIKAYKKKRNCMFDNCKKQAINSHVLQKNGILKQISEDNHLIQVLPNNAYYLQQRGLVNIKKIGINKAYSFYGFCKSHDNKVFSPIENTNKLDLNNPYHQLLFSYRGLCQEIRRKEISLEYMNRLYCLTLSSEIKSCIDGYEAGIKNLSYFKKEMETAINSNNVSSFYFETVELPKVELCISVPLNIQDIKKSSDLTYEEWKSQELYPRATSFINVIPLKDRTYFLGGYHKNYPCGWIRKKIKKFKKAKNKIILKELSDMIVLRLEFWTMSPKLFKSIPSETINKYKSEFSENVFSHSPSLRTNINLFENVKLK